MHWMEREAVGTFQAWDTDITSGLSAAQISQNQILVERKKKQSMKKK